MRCPNSDVLPLIITVSSLKLKYVIQCSQHRHAYIYQQLICLYFSLHRSLQNFHKICYPLPATTFFLLSALTFHCRRRRLISGRTRSERATSCEIIVRASTCCHPTRRQLVNALWRELWRQVLLWNRKSWRHTNQAFSCCRWRLLNLAADQHRAISER